MGKPRRDGGTRRGLTHECPPGNRFMHRGHRFIQKESVPGRNQLSPRGSRTNTGICREVFFW
ncbi:hypothetical protein J2Z21_003104 [Streptomyces griseochromogenes]|uniref:Uncharacterized protein n=1 Tax=Streptomyces griseochromogenes TaxID=68214 RepID=A0ABS4LRY1_9ACTN|nr:hypothetical protein [Streptomyces griseochromogenes]